MKDEIEIDHTGNFTAPVTLASQPATLVAGAPESRPREARCAGSQGSLSASRAEALAAEWVERAKKAKSVEAEAERDGMDQFAWCCNARAATYMLCAYELRRDMADTSLTTATENVEMRDAHNENGKTL